MAHDQGPGAAQGAQVPPRVVSRHGRELWDICRAVMGVPGRHAICASAHRHLAGYTAELLPELLLDVPERGEVSAQGDAAEQQCIRRYPEIVNTIKSAKPQKNQGLLTGVALQLAVVMSTAAPRDAEVHARDTRAASEASSEGAARETKTTPGPSSNDQ